MKWRFSKRPILLLVGFIIGILFGMGYIPLPDFSFWHPIAFILFLYINIYIHEFGHALAGVIVGFSIRRISIGTGRQIFRRRIGGLLFVITNSFAGGLTYLGEVSERFLKIRYFIFVLGGFLAQSLAVLITLIFLNIPLDDIVHPEQLSIGHVFIYSNLLLIALNLFPRYVDLGGIKFPSDGLQIVKTPFLNAQDIQVISSAGKIMEGYEFYESKKFAEAEATFRECAESYPESIVAKINIGAALLKQLKLSEAPAILETAIESHQASPIRPRR